jgi:hypothetical protein
MKTKITQNIKAIILGLIIAVGAGYVSAWTAPTQSPTGGNVAAPINVGLNSQIKSGILTLAHLFTSDLTVTNPDGSVTGIPTGSVLVADGTNTGKVKWGTIGAGGSYVPPSTTGKWYISSTGEPGGVMSEVNASNYSGFYNLGPACAAGFENDLPICPEGTYMAGVDYCSTSKLAAYCKPF